MNKTLALMTLVAVTASAHAPANAELPDIKKTVKTPDRMMPQQRTKRISKDVIAPRGTETAEQGGQTEEPLPQATADIRIGNITFSPKSSTLPACEIKWVVDISNSGTAESAPSLVMTPIYRRAEGIGEQTSHDMGLVVIPAGGVIQNVGYVPLRDNDETELVLTIRDGNTTLTSKVFPLPVSARASADSLSLDDATVTPNQITFAIRNTSNIPLNIVQYRIRGMATADGATSDHLYAGTLSCLSANESRTIMAEIPAAPYHSYKVSLFVPGTTQPLIERSYPRQ